MDDDIGRECNIGMVAVIVRISGGECNGGNVILITLKHKREGNHFQMNCPMVVLCTKNTYNL